METDVKHFLDFLKWIFMGFSWKISWIFNGFSWDVRGIFQEMHKPMIHIDWSLRARHRSSMKMQSCASSIQSWGNFLEPDDHPSIKCWLENQLDDDVQIFAQKENGLKKSRFKHSMINKKNWDSLELPRL